MAGQDPAFLHCEAPPPALGRKECGPIHIVGGVQNSLDIQAANEETVQVLSDKGTINWGTKPLKFKGKLEF